MSSTFGKQFQVTTWGESHGPAIGCVVDGCPSGLALAAGEIQKELDRRKPGQSKVTTARVEEDKVEILSGVFEAKTTGTPISLLIKNKDADSTKYEALKDTPRPGHADLTYKLKYGHVDWRGGGRASARETAARVAASVIAKKVLATQKIDIVAAATQIGEVESSISLADMSPSKASKLIESNSVRCLDSKAAIKMEEAIIAAQKEGDSVGGIIEAVAWGVPAGWGEPLADKLDADLAKALMSIPAVKAVEIGAGVGVAAMKGSEDNDSLRLKDGDLSTITNNAGGILGGISNGMPVVVRVAIKPTASIAKKQNTVNLTSNENTEIQISGRHDPCIVPRAVPVVEAVMGLVLVDHGLRAGSIPRVF